MAHLNNLLDDHKCLSLMTPAEELLGDVGQHRVWEGNKEGSTTNVEQRQIHAHMAEKE